MHYYFPELVVLSKLRFIDPGNVFIPCHCANFDDLFLGNVRAGTVQNNIKTHSDIVTEKIAHAVTAVK